MQNIKLEPLVSSRVQSTTSMQPQMVARGCQNPFDTPNSCIGSTSRGNPLPWNFNKRICLLEYIKIHPNNPKGN